MHFELLFVLSILVCELPVVLGLFQLSFSLLHVFHHVLECVCMLTYQSEHLLLLLDIVALMLAEKCTMWANSLLAALLQADQLFESLVLRACAECPLHLLLLLLLDLFLGLGKPVAKVG